MKINNVIILIKDGQNIDQYVFQEKQNLTLHSEYNLSDIKL